MKKILFAAIALHFLLSDANAQLRKTIRGEFQLPRATWNPAFTKAFSGVFNGGISFNLAPRKNGFSYGAFYSLTQYQIFPKYFTDPRVVQTNHTIGAKIHYDMLTSSGKGMFSPFIAPGYSFIKYTRIKSKNHPPYQPESKALSVNIGMTYNIMMDEWTGAGFIVGFNMIDHVYMPQNVCMDEWGIDYKENDSKGSFKNIFFGFSVYFDLAWKPETSE